MTSRQALEAALKEAEKLSIDPRSIEALRKNLSLPEFLKFVALQVYVENTDSELAKGLRLLQLQGCFNDAY